MMMTVISKKECKFRTMQALSTKEGGLKDGTSYSDLALLYKGKSVGDLKVDMRYFPVSKPIKREDGLVEPPAESSRSCEEEMKVGRTHC